MPGRKKRKPAPVEEYYDVDLRAFAMHMMAAASPEEPAADQPLSPVQLSPDARRQAAALLATRVPRVRVSNAYWRKARRSAARHRADLDEQSGGYDAWEYPPDAQQDTHQERIEEVDANWRRTLPQRHSQRLASAQRHDAIMEAAKPAVLASVQADIDNVVHTDACCHIGQHISQQQGHQGRLLQQGGTQEQEQLQQQNSEGPAPVAATAVRSQDKAVHYVGFAVTDGEVQLRSFSRSAQQGTRPESSARRGAGLPAEVGKELQAKVSPTAGQEAQTAEAQQDARIEGPVESCPEAAVQPPGLVCPGHGAACAAVPGHDPPGKHPGQPVRALQKTAHALLQLRQVPAGVAQQCVAAGVLRPCFNWIRLHDMGQPAWTAGPNLLPYYPPAQGEGQQKYAPHCGLLHSHPRPTWLPVIAGGSGEAGPGSGQGVQEGAAIKPHAVQHGANKLGASRIGVPAGDSTKEAKGLSRCQRQRTAVLACLTESDSHPEDHERRPQRTHRRPKPWWQG